MVTDILLCKDLPTAIPMHEILEKLDFASLRHRTVYAQALAANTLDGLYEGLDWISTRLQVRASAAQNQRDDNTMPKG